MTEAAAPALTTNIWAIAAFVLYLGIITLIGILSARFSSGGLSEYFLAGRKLNRVIVALSAVVSGRSSWLLLGFTGMAYVRGASALWAVVGYIVVEFFLFFFYAPRLRRFSERYDIITLPDFFAKRFRDRGALRILLVLIIFVFLGSYVAAQFVGGGKAFAAGFHLDPTTGLLVTAAIVLLYTLLGGFLAVSWTDMLQAVFMLVALVVLPMVAVLDKGGWPMIAASLSTLDPAFLDVGAIGFGALIGLVGIGLGSPGNPHILVRYMAIDDPRQLKISAVVGTAWNVIMAVGALYVGLIGRAYFPDVAMLGGDPENLYPILAEQHLHPVLFGVVVAAIFAAIMSTADSQLLVAASAVVVDIYQKMTLKGRELSQRRLVLYSRIVVVLLVLLAILFGLLAKNLVFWLVLFAWAGLGAALGPTSILALYWKGTTRAGVIAGMLAGTATVLVWYLTPALKSVLYELIPAFAISALVTWVVSLLTTPPADAEQMMAAMKEETEEGI